MEPEAHEGASPKATKRDLQVVVHINGEKVFGTAGETLLEVADRAGGLLDSQCLAGACGTCMVQVIAGAEHLHPVAGAEAVLLEPEELLENKRLACQARLRGDVSVVSAIPY